MIRHAMRLAVTAGCLAGAFSQVPQGADWTPPVEVRHDTDRCLAYRARWSGEYLVVRVDIEPGWHTFAMDNRKRAEEKLAGKRSLGIDQPTEIRLMGELEADGPWYQTPPQDSSKPELNWFTWTFEKDALFAAKVRRTGAAPARIGIRAQACTETKCKNIDIEIPLPAAPSPGGTGVDWKTLEPVR